VTNTKRHPRQRTGLIRRKRRGEPDRRGTTYEAWRDEFGIAFFPSANESARATLTWRAKLLYKFQAESWEAAMTEHHRRQGWEPYKP
jgi:hypothetical protein